MPINSPTGYISRPQAPKLFNRSLRALEREVENALAIQDEKVLSHWKLVTKDGTLRDGGEVTTDLVNDLVASGETPTWCVEEVYLEARYGRRGVPKAETEPDRQAAQRQHRDSPKGDTTGDAERREPSTGNPKPLPDDVAFLKERIRTLEREKRDEAERNEKREAKLFEQLAVKDRQISAWDELSQGLTRALATGQLTPMLPSAPRRTQPAHGSAERDDATTEVVEAVTAPEGRPRKTSRQRLKPKQPREKPARKKRGTAHRTSASKKKKGSATTKKPHKAPTAFAKHAPTFHKALSSLFRR